MGSQLPDSSTPLPSAGADLHPVLARNTAQAARLRHADHWANAIYSLKDWRDHYGLEGRRLTYLLAASPFAARALGSAFNLPAEGKTSAVLELGYPRNDYLSDFQR